MYVKIKSVLMRVSLCVCDYIYVCVCNYNLLAKRDKMYIFQIKN